MHERDIDRVALRVLQAYPQPFPSGPLNPLFNSGGFSGACLWRIDFPSESWCLRAWPPDGPSTEQLTTTHALMRDARDAGLPFVPELMFDSAGRTWNEAGGRKWEITRWMPGRADFHDMPTLARLEAACHALATLHQAWARHRVANGPSPAVQRRLTRAAEWTRLVRSGWQPRLRNPLVERAWPLVCRRVDDIPRLLAPWVDHSLPLQPCLGDIWHDHVLYEGDSVRGIIDYGGVKIDHVAADIARLLGSLIEDDDELWQVGTFAYAQLCPWTEHDTALGRLLDETGAVLAVANWLRWLYYDGRAFENLQQVERRFGRLIERLERWEAATPRAAR